MSIANREDGIRGYALTNGMEIIGTYITEDAENIHLEQVIALNIENRNGTPAVQMVPPSFFAIGNVSGGLDLPLNKSVVLFPYVPKDDICDHYIQSTRKIKIASVSNGKIIV